GHAHHGLDSGSAVQREIRFYLRIDINIIDHIRAAFPQYLTLSLAEVGHAVSTNHAGGGAPGVFADYHKVIFIRLHVGIRGAVHDQMLTKHLHGYRYHLLRFRKRQKSFVQVHNEPVFHLRDFSFGNIGRSTDDVSHTAIGVSRKDLVTAVKPAPRAVVVAHPVFEIGGFFVAQTGQLAEVIEKKAPVVRVHDGANELSLLNLPRGIAQCSRGAAIGEDVLPLLDIEDVHHARRDIDDVLHETPAAFDRFVGDLMLTHVAHHFREPAQVPYLIGYTAAPDPTAILALLPALILTASCRTRNLQLIPNPSVRSMVSRIEDRERMSNGLPPLCNL